MIFFPENWFLFSGKNKKNISKCFMLNFVPRVLSISFQQTFWIFSYFFLGNRIWHFMQIVSKCSIVFWKNKRIINMLSAETAQRVLTINFQQMTFWNSFRIFSQEAEFDISCKLSPIETVCMKCQILLAGKIRKVSSNILSAAEIAQRVVSALSNFLLKMTHLQVFVEKKTHKTRQSVWSIL